MTKHTRRNHGAVFEVKVALEAIKGEQTLVELAACFLVHPRQIAKVEETAFGQGIGDLR